MIDPGCKVHRVSRFVAMQIVPDTLVEIVDHDIRNLQSSLLEKSIDRYRGISDLGGQSCIPDIYASHSLQLPSLVVSIWLVVEASS